MELSNTFILVTLLTSFVAISTYRIYFKETVRHIQETESFNILFLKYTIVRTSAVIYRHNRPIRKYEISRDRDIHINPERFFKFIAMTSGFNQPVPVLSKFLKKLF